MTKTKIRIEVDCEEKHCGECEWLSFMAKSSEDNYVDPVCDLFVEDLAPDNEKTFRSEKCLNAQVGPKA